jgi:predicted ATPase
MKAIKQLVQQILTESEEKLQDWNRRISHGVGTNGQIVIEMMPELELIIGIYTMPVHIYFIL